MPCYEIKWREVYEMKTMVVAPSLEAALAAGAETFRAAARAV